MSELSVGALSGLAANSYVIDVASGSSLDLSNGAVLPAGSIIDVKHALKTGAQATGGIAQGGNTIVTDLTITHEVADASNKLIISCFLGSLAVSTGRGAVVAAIHDGTDFIAIGDADGSRLRATAGGRTSVTADGRVVSSPSFTFVHTPGAGSKTYTVRVFQYETSSGTLYINRSKDDVDSGNHVRTASSLVIQEVAG